MSRSRKAGHAPSTRRPSRTGKRREQQLRGGQAGASSTGNREAIAGFLAAAESSSSSAGARTTRGLRIFFCFSVFPSFSFGELAAGCVIQQGSRGRAAVAEVR